MFRRITTILVVIACTAIAVAAGKVRTWTSTDGRTMEAEFVRELDGDVTFLKDGKLIVIRVEKLSEKDQQVIKDLSSGKEPDPDSSDRPAAGGSTPGENPDGAVQKPKKPIAIQNRTWTDRSGNKSSGKFVRVDGNDVVLNRGTKVITVPFENLSDGDQEYVREILISQGKEADIPSGTPVGGGGGAGVGGGVGVGMPGGRNPPAGGRGPGMPGMPGLPPGIAPGVGGGMPGGAGMPPGMGAGRGPGMTAGDGPPSGMLPPVTGGVPPGIPPGMAGGIGGGPGRAGMPGSNIPGGPGSMPGTGTMPGMPAMPGAGAMPGMGSMPGTGTMPGMGNMPGTGAMPGMGSMPGTGAMPGMGSMPGSGGLGNSGPGGAPGFPSMERTSIPSVPSIQLEEYFECSKCGAKLTKQETSGNSCPRCNATWGFKQDQFGNKTMTSAGRGQVTSVAVVIIVVVLVGLVAFVALFIGIIVAIVKAASSGGARPPHPQPMPQQRYY